MSDSPPIDRLPVPDASTPGSQPIDLVLGRPLGLESFFKEALDRVAEITGQMPSSSIYIVDEVRREFVLGLQQGLIRGIEGDRGRVAMDTAWLGQVATTGEPFLVEDMLADPRSAVWAEQISMFRSVVALPLHCQGRLVGIIDSLDIAPNGFSSETMTRLNDARQILEVSLENLVLQSDNARVHNLSNAILNSMAEGIVVVDEDNHIVQANPVMETMIGFSPRQILGSDVDKFLPLSTVVIREFLEKLDSNSRWP